MPEKWSEDLTKGAFNLEETDIGSSDQVKEQWIDRMGTFVQQPVGGVQGWGGGCSTWYACTVHTGLWSATGGVQGVEHAYQAQIVGSVESQ